MKKIAIHFTDTKQEQISVLFSADRDAEMKVSRINEW
jgi:hypothetical protein